MPEALATRLPDSIAMTPVALLWDVIVHARRPLESTPLALRCGLRNRVEKKKKKTKVRGGQQSKAVNAAQHINNNKEFAGTSFQA